MARFCYAPWKAITISNKQVSPCCYTTFKPTNDIPKALVEYQTCDELIKIKQEFLKGIEPAVCGHCWDMEASGARSKRQLFNNDYNYDDSMEISQQIIDEGIVDIEFSTGNVCNLQCKTCHSTNSSKWVKIENNLISRGFDIKVPVNQPKYLMKDKHYLDAILTQKKLKRITMLGGEPLLGQEKEHIELLSNLDGPNIEELEYITNGTIIPSPEIVELWRKFPNILINFSVDGVGDIFEYTRSPAKWDTFLETYDFFEELTERGNFRLSAVATVSILNVLGMPEMLEWAKAKNLEISFSPVIFPQYYSLFNLPENIKQIIYKSLDGIPELAAYTNYLRETPSDDTHIDDTRAYIMALDDIHGHSFNKLFPELANILRIV